MVVRIVFGLVQLYLGVGLIFGLIRLGSGTLHAAMAVPPIDELLTAAGVAALDGIQRALFWGWSLYGRVIAGNEPLVEWLLY